MSGLERDATMADVADALGMTVKWLRSYMKKAAADGDPVEHMRVGGGPNARIRFTAEQVDKLRSRFTVNAEPPAAQQSITTRRKRRQA